MKNKINTINTLRFISLLALLVASQSLVAQKTVLQKDVRKQNARNEKQEWGPNSKFFNSNIYGMSFILPVMENDSMAIRTNASSHQMYLGSRHKLKLTEHLALGSDILYMRQAFRIKQDSAVNLLSRGFENNKQRLSFHTIALGLHVRFNFEKRGDFLGKYLDIGAEGHYVFAERNFTKNRTDPALNNGSKEVRINRAKLDYTKDLQQFAVVRLGWNKFLLSARYRLSDIFTASANINGGVKLPELPRFSVGIEFVTWSSKASKSGDEIDY